MDAGTGEPAAGRTRSLIWTRARRASSRSGCSPPPSTPSSKPASELLGGASDEQPSTNSAQTAALEALIEAHATELKLPTVKARFRQMAAEAVREQQTPVAYLAALLEAEMHERAERRERRRLLDARFPLLKRLEEFRFADNPKIPQATIAALADGAWINDRDSIVLVGDSGTGKTHLAIALAVCACQQGRRVRFTTLAGLANELQEADSRTRARPGRRPLLPHRGRGLGSVPIPRLCRHRRRCRAERRALAGFLAGPAGPLVGIVTGSRGTRGSRRRVCNGRV